MSRRLTPADERSVAPRVDVEEWREAVATLGLSPRQAEVVELILCGMRDKQIAASLGLRVSTIRMHLRHVFARLNVADRMELVLHVFAAIRREDRTRHSPK